MCSEPRILSLLPLNFCAETPTGWGAAIIISAFNVLSFLPTPTFCILSYRFNKPDAHYFYQVLDTSDASNPVVDGTGTPLLACDVSDSAQSRNHVGPFLVLGTSI